MRWRVRIVVVLLIGGLILIQLFQPDRNKGTIVPEIDLLTISAIPDSLASILKNSCYDCHSNRTNYPWYSYIVPISWMLEKHIDKGKEALNLSSFGNLEKAKKIGALTDLCDVIESGSMPLKSYLIIHRNARIMEAEAEKICNWTEMEALGIMRE
jgi:hypothetical protein